MAEYQRWYRAGTASVANGETAVTGTLTAWLANARPGDLLSDPSTGHYAEIASIEENTGLTLGDPWPGTTLDEDAYAIIRVSPAWELASDLAVRIAALIETQTDIYSGEGAPGNELGGDGSVYFQTDEPKLYKKAAGEWDAGVTIVGPMGATGPGFHATSTTELAIGTGSKALSIGTGKAYSAGMRVRAYSTSGPTNWMEGLVTSYTGGTLTINVDKTNGSGTISNWTVNVAGEPGATGATGATGDAGATGSTGATGAGYGGTSTTSRTLGTGSMVFTTQAGMAYVIGSRVRAASAAAPTTKWMEGVVTGYSSTSLTILMDLFAGSGSAADWNFSLIGQRGATGATGDTGAAGSNGAAGSVFVATSTTSLLTAVGSKAFTVAAGLGFVAGQRLRAVSAANAANWMSGIVASYASTTLTLTVDLIGPSPDTAADWNIALTGEKGDQGPAGGFGALSATKGNWPLGDGTTFGALGVGADGTIPQASSGATFGIAWSAVDAVLGGGNWTSTDVASAATCDIGAATTPFVRVTGATTITSFGTAANKLRFVRFAGALVLTYNGTSLVLPGTGNIITVAGDIGIFASDASGNWRCIAWTPVGFLPRETLTADRTYYVRTDGSDSNNGLANTAGGAFLTLQKAITTILSLDCSIYNITVQVGAGTYTGGVLMQSPILGSGSLTIVGDATTPANVKIVPASGHCINMGGGARLSLSGVQLNAGASYNFVVGAGCLLKVTGAIDHAGGAIHNFATEGGKILYTTGYTVSAKSVGRHVYCDGSGSFVQYVGQTINYTGGINFTVAGVHFSNYAMGLIYNNTYVYPTVTVTIATPGVVTWTGHNRSANDPVAFFNNGDTLPTGLVLGTTYYVKTVLDPDTFTLSATPGGAAIDTTGSQSGTHKIGATGTRYNGVNLGTIETTGAFASLPGNAAGAGTNPATSPYGYVR